MLITYFLVVIKICYYFNLLSSKNKIAMKKHVNKCKENCSNVFKTQFNYTVTKGSSVTTLKYHCLDYLFKPKSQFT